MQVSLMAKARKATLTPSREKKEEPKPEEKPKTEEEKLAESQQFYKEAGYPQYAGKYEAPEVPVGYKVKEITETKEGLQFTYERPLFWYEYFRPEPEPKTPVGYVRRFLFGSGQVQPLGGTMGVATMGFKGVVGEVALWEATVGKIEVAAGKPTHRAEMMTTERLALEWGLRAGTVAMVKYGFPKIEKGAESWLTKQYIKKGPLAWKGIPEKLVMGVTRAKPYLSREIVSAPTGGIIPSHKVYSELWQYGAAPKTSLFFVEKAAAPIIKFTPEYLIYGTAMVPLATKNIIEVATKQMPIGYAEPWKKVPAPISGGLPQPTITELTKPFIGVKMPYIPTIEPMGLASTRLPQLLGIGLTLGAEAVPKPKRITKQKRRAFPISIPKLSQPSISKEASVQKLVQPQIIQQKTIQKQKQILVPSIPTPTIPQYKPSIPKLPLFQFPKGRRKRKEKDLFGLWFKREHPIPTAKYMAHRFGLGFPKKRKKKEKRKKSVKMPRF